jgi:hypothetical protein
MEIIESTAMNQELIDLLVAKDCNTLLKLQFNVLKKLSILIDNRFMHYDTGLATEIFDNLIKIYTSDKTTIVNLKKLILSRNDMSRHSLYNGFYTEITLCNNKELLKEIYDFLA